MKLLATGAFEAAEQQKLAIVQRAEREREAVIQVAQGSLPVNVSTVTGNGKGIKSVRDE